MKNHVRKISLFFLLIFMTACSSIPLTSMIKLRKLDLMTVDFRRVKVAIQLPDGLDVLPDSTRLMFKLWQDGDDQREKHVIILEEQTEIGSGHELSDQIRSGFHFSIFYVPARDYDRIAQLREKAKIRKSTDPDKYHGSFSISAKACHQGSLPDGKLLMSTFIRSAELGEYVLLFSDVDLRNYDKDGSQEKALPDCKTGIVKDNKPK